MSLDKFKIEKTTRFLLDHLDSEAKVEITVEGDGCQLNIETDASGLLIGRHGETLQALQHILRLMMAKEFEEFIPLSLDIAGYRTLRRGEIEDMTKKAAEKVVNFGGSEALPPMGAYERRLAHMILQEFENLEGISEGEEPDRRIIVKLKK